MSPTLTDLDSLLSARHSCRAFRPDPVPRPIIEQLLLAAQKVPSWCNAQPWKVTLVSGATTDHLRKVLMEQAKAGHHEPDLPFPTRYEGEYQERRRTCGWALYEAVGVKKGDREASSKQMLQNFSFFGAPHVAILSSPVELGPYGAMDCGGYVAAFTLAATAAGLASIPQAAIASHAPVLHDVLNIPSNRSILCAISFGYGDVEHPANGFRTSRAELDDFVDWRS